LKTFPVDCQKKIEEALASTSPEEKQVLNLTMIIELSNLDAFNKALSEIISAQ